MIAKLLALFQNRPATRKEELMIEALRRETRLEHHGDRHANDTEERVQEIMRSITANPAEPSSPESPATSYLMPSFGALAAMALVLFVFISLSEQDKLASPITEPNFIDTPEIEAYPTNPSAEPLHQKSLNSLREVALALPLATEATRLKRDIRSGTDSLLAIVLPWGDIVNSPPTLTIPVFPPLPQTPYQTELENLRRDAMNALDFLNDSISEFRG